MPLFLRPSTLTRASQTLCHRTPTTTTSPTSFLRTPPSTAPQQATSLTHIANRTLTTTTLRASGDAHESQYDPPSGWLFGIAPGQKYEKEGWEGIWYWGFCGSLGVAAVAYAFKPDTGIETWALEEAKRRLQAEGTLPEDDE